MQLSPEQTRQDRYQETLEAVGDKGQKIKNVTKVNESKQCMEEGLQEEPKSGYILFYIFVITFMH